MKAEPPPPVPDFVGWSPEQIRAWCDEDTAAMRKRLVAIQASARCELTLLVVVPLVVLAVSVLAVVIGWHALWVVPVIVGANWLVRA